MNKEEITLLSNFTKQKCKDNCEESGNCHDCWIDYETVQAVENLMKEYLKAQSQLQQEKEELIKTNKTNKELANLYLKYEPIITEAKWQVNEILNNKNAEVKAFNHKPVDDKIKQLLLLYTEALFIQEEINKLKESDK